MTTITEIIARLGHACGLPWAEPYTLNVVDHSTHRVTTYSRKAIPPTLAEWQAEHEREHPGEPGPVASWTSEDGRVSWNVIDHMVQVDVGDLRCRRFAIGGIVLSGDGTGRATAADLTELARLVAAADGGVP